VKREYVSGKLKSLGRCCVQGCDHHVARNTDGSRRGNYRCTEHTYAYYAPTFVRGVRDYQREPILD
jgi:hypothetical protein